MLYLFVKTFSIPHLHWFNKIAFLHIASNAHAMVVEVKKRRTNTIAMTQAFTLSTIRIRRVNKPPILDIYFRLTKEIALKI